MKGARGDRANAGVRVAALASLHMARVALFGGAQLLVPAGENAVLDLFFRTLVFAPGFQWLFRPARRDLERLSDSYGPRVYLLAVPGALATVACVWFVRSHP